MILSTQDLNTLCSTAETAARKAGDYIQSRFDQHFDKTNKEGGDSLASQVVTEVDLKAQEIILEHLHESIQKYDLGLLTEEAADDSSRLEKDYFWCVDPMDGTLAFTESRSGYSVSIALISKAGDPIIGAVCIPDKMEVYSSILGKGLQLNGEKFKHPTTNDQKLHFYRDNSMEKESYYDPVVRELRNWVSNRSLELEVHVGYGAVRNAIAVIHSSKSCYFKFPKKRKGGGSIWDFAATRLFFEELGLPCSDSFGEKLELNNPNTTFMNDVGVLYTNEEKLSNYILNLARSLASE
ncbi:3'(2'), 5'-bisphosphate nucleotidase [Marivirga sericea]|uniref:3'(2'), 5'-bisphosphate nucleotidase n=1 Tax=Marivirga sericea TaxID=1028 RepID=A0A1X7IF93_9BACT|nr:inositol monophosphatase family protein [Marivirga sericea]SMG13440.1 3'(2'), 5'-bisphosphate nucleotidase [Marivirga sericea]